MTKITIENIVASAQISSILNIKKISEESFDFKYNPDEFIGATLKLCDPKTAVLLFPDGKLVCTGAKSMDEIDSTIKKTTEKIEKMGMTVKKKPEIEIKNVVASINLKKDMHLSSISKALLLQDVSYEPKQFPGLIYKIKDSSTILLLFSSGKLVCTGANSIEDANSAIEMMKDKLSSIGVL